MAVRCHLPLLYDASTAHYQCAINSKIGEIRIRSHVPQAYVAYTHITRMNEMWMMSHDDRLFCAMAPYHTQTEKTKLFWSSASFITFLLFLICVKLGYFRMFLLLLIIIFLHSFVCCVCFHTARRYHVFVVCCVRWTVREQRESTRIEVHSTCMYHTLHCIQQRQDPAICFHRFWFYSPYGHRAFPRSPSSSISKVFLRFFVVFFFASCSLLLFNFIYSCFTMRFPSA